MNLNLSNKNQIEYNLDKLVSIIPIKQQESEWCTWEEDFKENTNKILKFFLKNIFHEKEPGVYLGRGSFSEEYCGKEIPQHLTYKYLLVDKIVYVKPYINLNFGKNNDFRLFCENDEELQVNYNELKLRLKNMNIRMIPDCLNETQIIVE